MPMPWSPVATSPDTTTDRTMGAGDVSRAVRYLFVIVIVYALVAIGTGGDVAPIELVVLLAGVLALVAVAERLGD